jgi:hypothetical protein
MRKIFVQKLYAFILLLVSFLDASQVSKEEILGCIYSSFRNRKLEKYSKIRFYYKNYTFEFLEALSEIFYKDILHFAIQIQSRDSFIFYILKNSGLNCPVGDYAFQSVIGKFISNIKFEKQTSNQIRKTFALIISILKRINYSAFKKVSVSLFFLSKFSIPTSVLIDALYDFANNYEDDCIAGFDKAFYLLKGLSIRYKGDIPRNPKLKAKIYSLIFTCCCYSKLIWEHRNYAMRPETEDPLKLLFLLRHQFLKDTPKALFWICRNYSMIGTILREFLEEFGINSVIRKIMKDGNFKKFAHPRHSLQLLFSEETLRARWNAKVFLSVFTLFPTHFYPMLSN